MTKQRFLRRGDELTDDTMIVIRGGLLEEMLLRSDALRNFEVYGTFGISVFAIKDSTVDAVAAEARFGRFERLTLIRAGELRARGLRIEPTGQNVRHYDVGFDVLDDGIAALMGCDCEIIENQYHVPD